MRMSEEVTLYVDRSEEYNPDTGEHDVIYKDGETYQCNISTVRDYVNDVAQGRLTGKTLKVRFLSPVGKFKYAKYGDKTYKPVGYVQVKNKQSVTLEEVVG